MTEHTPKTDDELRMLASDLYNGKIFSDRHIDKHTSIESIFMVLIFYGAEQAEALRAFEPAFIYEYMDKANPLSVNGYPTFFSARFLNKEELSRLNAFYLQYKEMQDKWHGGKP